MVVRHETQPWSFPGVPVVSRAIAYGLSSSCSTSFQFGTSFNELSGNSGSNKNAGRMIPGGADTEPVVVVVPGWAPAGNTGARATARVTTWVRTQTAHRLLGKRRIAALLSLIGSWHVGVTLCPGPCQAAGLSPSKSVSCLTVNVRHARP